MMTEPVQITGLAVVATFTGAINAIAMELFGSSRFYDALPVGSWAL
jgi:hypothetical protein